LFTEAIADGELQDDVDPRMTRLLVMGALTWLRNGGILAADRWTSSSPLLSPWCVLA
jgi:hypothetical protein